MNLKLVAILLAFFSYAAVAAFYPVNRGMVNQATSITSSGGTTTLVATSNQVQIVGGSSAHTIQFPNATLLPLNWWYHVLNDSSGSVTVKDGSGATIGTVAADQVGHFLMTARASSAGSWQKNILVGLNDLGSIAANVTSADALSSTPEQCSGGFFATGIDANGDANCTVPSGAGDILGPSSSTDNAIARFDGTSGKILQNSGVTIDDSNNVTATSFIGSLTGNASTATNLAANPSDCGAGTKAISIDAGGNLTCSAVSLTADVSNTLPEANGGTGESSYTDGQLLIGNSSNSGLTKATLTAGTNISVTNGNGSISVAVTGLATLLYEASGYIDTTSNCLWSRTSSSLGAFTADTDCPGPTVASQSSTGGTLQTTDADLPRFTVNSLTAGTCEVEIGINVDNSGGTSDLGFTIFDGTSSAPTYTSFSALATGTKALRVRGTFVYGSSGTRSFEVYSAAASGDIRLHNLNSFQRTTFHIVCFTTL